MVTLTVEAELQPLASVTVITYVFAAKPVAVFPLKVIPPVLVKVYGAVPPVPAMTITPVEPPLHNTSVLLSTY